VAFVKQTTSKPVVSVGRFTSPDTMVSMVRRGIVDFIGAARPSIADPFLPKKIEEGRPEDIRECIGCNVCLASNMMTVPIRCTQNPTMSEDWRRGWHPERVPARNSEGRVLVVGGGPAGLEAARTAAARGYDVTLAEASGELGGHLNRLVTLPGLAEWIRVRDWRVGQIQKMPNVEIYRDSRLDADQVVEFGFEHVIVATGSAWRRDGVGASNIAPLSGHERDGVLTPDDVLAGAEVTSPVLVFDDDPHVMGGALAEMLAAQGHKVTLVCPAPKVSIWSQFAGDQQEIHRDLIRCGIEVVLKHNLSAVGNGTVTLKGMFGEEAREREAATVVLVTSRAPDNRLFSDLQERRDAFQTLTAIGDCHTPRLLSEAVFSGHEAGRGLDGPDTTDLPFRVEQVPADFDPPMPWPSNRD